MPSPKLQLRTITNSDLPLLRQIYADENMMRYLGGRLTEEQIIAAHQNLLDAIEAGGLCCRIVVGQADLDAGIVTIWNSKRRGIPIREMGWMVLPEFQRIWVCHSDSRFGAMFFFPQMSCFAKRGL